MLDSNESSSSKEIVELINENNGKIISLKKQLELSEVRRETAEKMLTEIKESVSSELKEAYKSGYNAAISSINPQGGTTISNNDNKTLVLGNQN